MSPKSRVRKQSLVEDLYDVTVEHWDLSSVLRTHDFKQTNKTMERPGHGGICLQFQWWGSRQVGPGRLQTSHEVKERLLKTGC